MDAGQTANTLREPRPSKPNGRKRQESIKRLGMKIIRPSVYVIIGLLAVSVGFGTWSYFGSRRQVDEGDSISELDGLDFTTPAFESTKVSKQSSTLPIRAPASMGTASERSNSGGANAQKSAEGQDRFAAVWLTGTIEEVERSDSADPIRRISGGRRESTNFR